MDVVGTETVTADDRGVIAFFAGTPWSGHQLGAQHIARRLATYRDVLYVDPPVPRRAVRHKPYLADVLDGERRTRRVADGLHRLSPVVVPGKTRAGLRSVAMWQLRRQVVAAVDALGTRVEASVIVPVHFPIIGQLGERRRVHLASDDFLAGARMQGVSPAWVERQERRVARHVDAVVATSPVLVKKWRSLGHDPILMPNGCDYDVLSAASETTSAPDVTLPRPIAGFVGTLSNRTDVALLDRLARLGVSVLLVGPRSFTAPAAELDALFDLPNVQWVGPRPFDAMPSYLAAIDVGLVPYTDSAFNRASFPLKALDYLAAGCAVVSTDLPSIRWLNGSDDVIHIATTRDGFVDLVARTLRTPAVGEVPRRQQFAKSHGWDQRVERMAKVLEISPT